MKRLLSSLVFLVALLLMGVVLSLKLAGFTVHPIVSGSMEPSIMTGDAVVVRNVPVSTLSPGDVITFSTEGAALGTAHRIVSIAPKGLGYSIVTKGDNNRTVDLHPYLATTPTLGKVSYTLPKVGNVSQRLQTQGGRIFLGSLFALVLIVTLWPSSRRDDSSTPTSEPSNQGATP